MPYHHAVVWCLGLVRCCHALLLPLRNTNWHSNEAGEAATGEAGREEAAREVAGRYGGVATGWYAAVRASLHFSRLNPFFLHPISPPLFLFLARQEALVCVLHQSTECMRHAYVPACHEACMPLCQPFSHQSMQYATCNMQHAMLCAWVPASL